MESNKNIESKQLCNGVEDAPAASESAADTSSSQSQSADDKSSDTLTDMDITLATEHANMAAKILELEKELLSSQVACGQLQARCNTNEEENKLKEDSWQGKEELWKLKILEADREIAELTKNLQNSKSSQLEGENAVEGLEAPVVIDVQAEDGAVETEQSAAALLANLETTELKTRLVNMGKSHAALRLELRCAAMELKMKDKLDVCKTQLITLLDKKLCNLRARNDGRLEQLAESTLKPMQEQEVRINDVLQQLVISQKVNEDLIKLNNELRSMLGDLEEKAKKIASMAKEKVHKYVDLNKELQEKIDELTKQNS